MQAAHTVLKACSAIYMTYLAYKIAAAKSPSGVADITKPMALS
jgi:threonine/homoserine/homoserine lactone efflux protein